MISSARIVTNLHHMRQAAPAPHQASCCYRTPRNCDCLSFQKRTQRNWTNLTTAAATATTAAADRWRVCLSSELLGTEFATGSAERNNLLGAEQQPGQGSEFVNHRKWLDLWVCVRSRSTTAALKKKVARNMREATWDWENRANGTGPVMNGIGIL